MFGDFYISVFASALLFLTYLLLLAHKQPGELIKYNMNKKYIRLMKNINYPVFNSKHFGGGIVFYANYCTIYMQE